MPVISGDTLEGVSEVRQAQPVACAAGGRVRDREAQAYLDPDDAMALIRACAARFPGGRMMFDNVPPFFSRRTLKGLDLSDRYTAPPMPFAMTPDDGVALAGTVPGVRSARDVSYPPGRGLFTVLGWRPFDRGALRRFRPSITLLEFDR